MIFFFLFLKLFPKFLAFRAAGAGADLALRPVLSEAFLGSQDGQGKDHYNDYGACHFFALAGLGLTIDQSTSMSRMIVIMKAAVNECVFINLPI